VPRRGTINLTGIERVEGIRPFDAWVGYVCVKCRHQNHVPIGRQLITPLSAYATAKWKCEKCGYIHSGNASLPFKNWPSASTRLKSLPAQRFWLGFFRTATEYPSSYWKQCNACGRILPFAAFSKHSGRGWGPLELQMECRSCKGVINAILNPLRTAQQLHESSVRRRVADLLLQGMNRPINIDDLFRRFAGKCFKCGKHLDKKDRKTWEIDHILPSRYLFPLTLENSALLCVGCNNSKHGRWPSEFYTNNELIRLSKLTGADVGLLASAEPIVNKVIDVNAGVSRYLTVREHSDLPKRIKELKELINDYELVGRLSAANKKLLGFE
jgi:5-methylcytosine-specific restriction endonuclease McrA